jgi:hypothetical protein
MKADWQRPGRATGHVRCRLRLPAIEEDVEYQGRSVLQLRRFLDKQLSGRAASAREGASLTISVEVRAPKHGSRWRPICRWREGDSVPAVLDRAVALISAIPREPGHDTAAYRGYIRSRSLLGLPKT